VIPKRHISVITLHLGSVPGPKAGHPEKFLSFPQSLQNTVTIRKTRGCSTRLPYTFPLVHHSVQGWQKEPEGENFTPARGVRTYILLTVWRK
jgi:hypothetical protein